MRSQFDARDFAPDELENAPIGDSQNCAGCAWFTSPETDEAGACRNPQSPKFGMRRATGWCWKWSPLSNLRWADARRLRLDERNRLSDGRRTVDFDAVDRGGDWDDDWLKDDPDYPGFSYDPYVDATGDSGDAADTIGDSGDGYNGDSGDVASADGGRDTGTPGGSRGGSHSERICC